MTGPLPRQYSYRATGEVATIFGAADRISESSFELPLRAATLSYDRFNRLKQVTGQNLVANYKISANDRRVEKSVRGVTTQFVYAQNGQLWYERDLESNRASQHLYFQGQLIGLVRNGSLYRVQADHLGRPEALVTNDANSTTVWRAVLLAFNRQVINNQIGGYNLGFPGQYHDEETGFVYNNFRDYDPATGRYLQADPIGLRGGVNPYGYVNANPLLRTDALGLWSVTLDVYRGYGGSVTFGFSGAAPFLVGQFGVGLNVGLSFDARGDFPRSDNAKAPTGVCVAAGVNAEIGGSFRHAGKTLQYQTGINVYRALSDDSLQLDFFEGVTRPNEVDGSWSYGLGAHLSILGGFLWAP